MIHEHFKGQGKYAYKASNLHWALISTLAVLFGLSFYGWDHGSRVAAFMLPIVHWVLAVNSCHDGSHFALSHNQHVNHYAVFTFLPFTSNPYTWYSQHVVSHHSHPNDHEEDV